MRIIFVIAAFAFVAVVYADPSNSGVAAETTSLQTRTLRDEVHGGIFRRRKRLGEAPVGVDQAPLRMKRIPPSIEKNGVGTASTRDQTSTKTRPPLRRENGQRDLNPKNAEETVDTQAAPERVPRSGSMAPSMVTEHRPFTMNRPVFDPRNTNNPFAWF
jgi:hypothetical protein